MLFTRQTAKAGANPESPPRTHPGTNIREVHTPSRTIFTQEKNELFFRQIIQSTQEKEGDDLNYHVLGLNESSTEDYTKKT